MTRRTLVSGLGATVVMLGCPAALFAQSVAPEVDPDGFRLLRAGVGRARLRGGEHPETEIWGYQGVTPGPLLRVRRGGEIKARLINGLSEPTAIHWRGVRLANGMDGVPHLTQAPVPPGGRFDYRFVAPDAGTFWYHASGSAAQVNRGLYGLLLVEEATPVDVDDDVVLVLDDWALRPDGSLDPAGMAPTGEPRPGSPSDVVTLNGRPGFDIPVRANARLRVRILNASTARSMAVQFERHQATVMAIDGQPAEPFAARDARVALAPGNRIDLFLDATLAPGAIAPIVIETTTARAPLGRLVYGAAPIRPAPRAESPPLPRNPLPDRMDFARSLKLEFPVEPTATRAQMRGQSSAEVARLGGDPRARLWTAAQDAGRGPPLFSAARGRTVMLAFANPAPLPCTVHLHGHHFRLLDALDDGWKPFWLDTLLVAPQQTARIAFVADNPGRWLIGWRALERPEAGLAAWFEVK